MIDLTFTATTTEELRSLRFNHPHPHVQTKMEALLLKAHNIPHHLIANITGKCENTIRSYFMEFQEGGIQKLQQLNFNKPHSDLDSKKDIIKAYFEKEPPATLNPDIS